jgi:hypothetical protein
MLRGQIMKRPSLNAVPIPPEVLGRHHTLVAEYYAAKGVAITIVAPPYNWDHLLQETYDRGDPIVELDGEGHVVAMYLKPI